MSHALHAMRRARRALGEVVGAAAAVAVAAAVIYSFGPWSAEPRPRSSSPRPLGTPVSVPGRTVSILAAGDILVHPELWDQARRDGGGRLDFAPILAPAKPTISAADLALCHLDTPLAAPQGPFSGFPLFNVPPQIALAVKSVGYDGCSTASNHSLDQGSAGIKRTLDTLDRARLGHTGTHRSAQEARRIAIYVVKGVRVAHLSYTNSFTGPPPPQGQEWSVNLLEPTKIQADADAARAAGAEIVLVSLHWGPAYQHEPDADQQTWARAIARIRNVDFVFGHHTHSVQPVERIDGKWIVYGMGNQIARHAKAINENREGAMIRVTFTKRDPSTAWRVGAVEAIPTFVDLNPDIRLVDLERALAEPTVSPGRRRIYEAAVDRIQGHLLTRGADRYGLIVRGVAPS